MKNRASLLLASIVSLATFQSSYAELISIPPGNVTASSEIPPGFNRLDDFIVDGSGMTGTTHGNGPPDGTMWLSRGTAFGGDDLDPSVTFDLGDVYTITSFHVWNYNELAGATDLTGRGVNGVSIEFGTTAALGSTVAGITNFARADTTTTYAGEVFDGFAPFTARFIKFDIDSNHGGDNNFYGLSEVRFDGILGSADVIVSPSSFSNLSAQDDLVGILATPSGDAGDTFSYTLVAGEGDEDNSKFQIDGDELQIGSHDFSTAPDGEMFSVRVLSTGAPSGATVVNELALSAFAPDRTDPMIIKLSPPRDTETAGARENLIVTFDEPIAIGTGDITILNLSDATELAIPVDDAQVTVSGSQLIINPSENLLADTSYAVQIDASAIDDLAGNSFAGIDDNTTWHFAVPPTPPITLVGYWPFDTNTDPQPDLSGFENDATVFTGATWVDDLERNGVMEFDGNDSYLEAADSESLSITGDITIAAWINVTDFTGFRGIVGKTAGPGGNLPASYDLYLVANDGRARLYTGSPDGFGQVTATTIPALAEWHHIAVTRIGDDVTFYYDGQADGQGVTAQPLLDSDATLRIGNRTDLVTDFLGKMDDVAIFAGGLSPDQITTIMGGDFSEFGAGGGSAFRINDIVYSGGKTPSVSFTFNSRPGRNYKVEASTSLNAEGTPGGWIELDDGFESQGELTTYIDTQAVGVGPRVFYRVSEN